MASERGVLATLFVATICGTASAQGPLPEPPAPPASSPPQPAPSAAPSTPAPATPAEPAPAASSAARTPPATEREYTLAFEVGYGWTADAAQAYGNGFGRVLMFGVRGVEIRALEAYDLEDRTGMLDARGVHGKLGMTSVGYRSRYRAGALSLRPLIGLAWIRRSAYTRDDELSFSERTTQHGLALQAGIGLELPLGAISLGIDVRAYPTLWSELTGERAVMRDGALVHEPITESPGGVPRTCSGWLAVHW